MYILHLHLIVFLSVRQFMLTWDQTLEIGRHRTIGHLAIDVGTIRTMTPINEFLTDEELNIHSQILQVDVG